VRLLFEKILFYILLPDILKINQQHKKRKN